MFVAIQTVHKGDTIKETYLDGQGRLQVEKGPSTKVGKVEHAACSKRGTHVNGRECFDFGTLVWRMDEAVSNEQAVLVDWDIDNNVPATFQPEITVGEYLKTERAFTWVKPEPASV